MSARRLELLLFMLVSLLGLPYGVGAQSAHGMIHGVVTDAAGAGLRGVTVRISGTEVRRFSDSVGEVLFEGMTPGRYRLTATYVGATPAADSVVVRAGDTARVRFRLVVKPFVPETVPPRYARGAKPDTAPSQTETIDRVARTAKLPLLRARPPRTGHRELRFWMDGGIAIPMSMVRLTIDGEQVRGEQIYWADLWIRDRDDDPRWRAFVDSVPTWLRETFGCGPVITDTLRYLRKRLFAVCTRRFGREPDWRALLRELETHHVWTLPDASELPTIGNIVSIHGGGLTVEAWDGTRYHAYSFGNTDLIPAPEARELGAIQRTLITFLRRTREGER